MALTHKNKTNIRETIQKELYYLSEDTLLGALFFKRRTVGHSLQKPTKY